MDAFTLHTSTAIASALMTLTLCAFYFVGNHQRCLLYWAGAGFLLFISNFIGLLSYFYSIPYFVGPSLANTCYVAGHLCFLVGVRSHFQLPPRWDSMAVILGLVFAAHYIPDFIQYMQHRLLFLYSLLMVISLVTASTMLLASKNKKMNISYYPFLASILLFFGVQFVRFIVVLFDETLTLTPSGDEVLQTTGTLLLFLFLLMMTFSCCLIVYRKQSIELARATEIDFMTGCFNYLSLKKQGSRIFSYSARRNKSLGVILVTVDNLHLLMKKYSAQECDAALKRLANILEFSSHQIQGVYRRDDASFVLLFEETSTDVLMTQLDRIQHKISEKRLLNVANTEDDLCLLFSAVLQRPSDDFLHALLLRAEDELSHSTYAKQAVKPAIKQEKHQCGAEKYFEQRFGMSSLPVK